ncbi:MAG: GNAT family N-acetyltransferase [Planctomycetes bacterium]|nr:GNAT family N-acetyltransferase [Planctomycetota bacterium]
MAKAKNAGGAAAKAPKGEIALRPVNELDIEAVCAIDEKLSGQDRPGEWERRISYYIRRDPELSLVALEGKKVVGFMLGEVRAGEFGLEEPAGWIEVLGVDPACQGRSVGRKLLEGMLEGFKARGAKAVRTLVNETGQKELFGFFEAGGFEPTPIRTLERKV